MTINRVSFGNVVDIKYRFRTPSIVSNAISRADKRAHDDSKEIHNELMNSNKSMDDARSMLISRYADDDSDRKNRFVIYRKFNRVITGDDSFTYNLLHNVNPEFAQKFADGKAQTVIIDV